MTEVQGKIVTMTKGSYTIETGIGERISCKARGALRHFHISPVVGDSVAVKIHDNGIATIEEIKTRKNLFIRPSMANLDCLFLVISAANPQVDTLWIDQMLAISEYANVESQLIITKNDLDSESAQKIMEDYQKVGYRIWLLDNSCTLLKDLRYYLESECKGKTLAFAGCSGVGKTTLMNKLFPQLHLETGEVSQKTEHGKHTTKHVEMYSLNSLFLLPDHNGYLADTPGFSFLDFDNFDFFSIEFLPQTFREFSNFIGNCKYTKCTHTKEEGCAIREAVPNGEVLDSRHRDYCLLYDILKNKRKWK